MYVYNDNFNPLEEYDLEKGKLVPKEIDVTHRYVIDTEEVGHWETIKEYPETGGADVTWRIDTPESGHWETYRDGDTLFPNYPVSIPDDWSKDHDAFSVFSYYVYVPYTEEELAEIGKQKSEDERLAKIDELKSKLANTDYVLIKMIEYNISGAQMSEDEATRYADVIEQRIQWRKEINELEHGENDLEVNPLDSEVTQDA